MSDSPNQPEPPPAPRHRPEYQDPHYHDDEDIPFDDGPRRPTPRKPVPRQVPPPRRRYREED